jgi:predicted NAD/FAD-binding protein
VKLAIVGTGIAGLGCAYFLHRHANITLFERNDYTGGHTHTLDVAEAGRTLPVDSGFMVFNYQTYPLLTRLFDQLAVPVKPTDMSFSVRDEALNLEWNGAGYNRLFGQRKNLINPRFWRMVLQMGRFCQEAVAALDDPAIEQQTLADFVAQRGYGRDFLDLFLVPMSGAIWSTPPEKMLQFPARTLIRFFHNHGFLGMDTHHPWFTVDGGAREYVRRLLAKTGLSPQLNSPVRHILQVADGWQVSTDSGSAVFDAVILACHADESAALTPDPAMRHVLSAFQYQANDTVFHSDERVMPRTRRCWGAWNYRIRPGKPPSTHYWMNRLQGVSERQSYFISLNEPDIDPAKIHQRLNYTHPLFDRAAIAAQAELPQLNARNTGLYLAGSYFRYGFHEDALLSAYTLSKQLLNGEPEWA